MRLARLNPLQIKLPQSAKLNNGEWVSNYNLLSLEELAAEGWLPLEEIQPTFDAETQNLEMVSAEKIDDKVVVTYTAVNKPPDEIDLFLDELEAEL